MKLELLNPAQNLISKSDAFGLEVEIDNLVYELYGLSEEEIKIVEGKNQ